MSDINNFKKIFHPCTVHFVIHEVHTAKNAHFIKSDKILKFTLKSHVDLLLHFFLDRLSKHKCKQTQYLSNKFNNWINITST